LFCVLPSSSLCAQHISKPIQAVLERVEQLQLRHKLQEAIHALEEAVQRTDSPDDLAHLYAHQSGLYASIDSLLIGKKILDLSLENAEKSESNTSKAIAYRAKAFFNNILALPDSVVKDALTGLKYLEGNDEDL